MLSSSEADPFTTVPPEPSHSQAQSLVHGFPKHRLSFRNVDRVRQRIGSKGSKGADKKTTGDMSASATDNLERKMGRTSVDAPQKVTTSGSMSWTIPISMSSKRGKTTQADGDVDEDEDEDVFGKRSTTAKDKKVNNGGGGGSETPPPPLKVLTASSAFALKTARQMETSSVGQTIPSSPTGIRPSNVAAHRRADEKLRRRRTFAGTTQHQGDLPHIDLVSKLVKSTSASPAVARLPLRRHDAPDPTPYVSKSLVLHETSRRKRRRHTRDVDCPSALNSMMIPAHHHFHPQGQLGGQSSGILLNQLSARSIELLIENGLAVVFKKMELNHGFANDTVKRAWLRCNGDIEATDRLLLTMRKAAEEAEASFLMDNYDDSVDVDDDRYASEREEEEEEEEELDEEAGRLAKRPRRNEPRDAALLQSRVSPSSSLDSRYVPQLSSSRRRDRLYPMEIEDYTPPVGTKAEVYRRLSEQGRSEEAQRVLIARVSPRKSAASIMPPPQKNNTASKGKESARLPVMVSLDKAKSMSGRKELGLAARKTTSPKEMEIARSYTGSLDKAGSESGRKMLGRDADVAVATTTPTTRNTLDGCVPKRVKQLVSTPRSTHQATVTRYHDLPPSSAPSSRRPEIAVPESEKDAGKKRVEGVIVTSPSDTASSIIKPPATSPESRSSSVRNEHEEKDLAPTPTPATINATTPLRRDDSHVQRPSGEERREHEKKGSSTGASPSHLEWTLSDEELLRQPDSLSQVEKLSAKYGERDVLRRFLEIVKS